MPEPSAFSEFSYGYAVTEALVRKWRPLLNVAPSFLSLLEEGSPGKGYDVGLQPKGIPVFLQFKLSEVLHGPNTRERRANISIPSPYFRFNLRTKPLGASQHDMLCGLDNGKNVVRYVAPLFASLEDFDLHYSQERILSESIFLRPQRIGLFADDDRHCVSFVDRKTVHWLSEPHTEEGLLDEENFQRDVLVAIDGFGNTALSTGQLRDLLGDMLRIINRDTQVAILYPRDRDGLLSWIGYLARVYFQAEMLIVRETGINK